MKAAVWVDYNKIELRDVPVPELGPGRYWSRSIPPGCALRIWR